MPGFDFSNHNRNVALHARGVPLPRATSTGTTIVGCVFDNGVVVRAASVAAIAFPSPPPRRPECSTKKKKEKQADLSLLCLFVVVQIAADTRATSGPIVADKV